MSIISTSLFFLVCFASFSTSCKVFTEPISGLADAWGGINMGWVSYDFPVFCPDIPGLDCGYYVGQLSTDDVEVDVALIDWYGKKK